jgi:hypothetical protein
MRELDATANAIAQISKTAIAVTGWVCTFADNPQ